MRARTCAAECGMTEGYGAKRRADRWVEGFVEHWEHEFTVYSIRRLPAEKHATMHDTETLITTEPTPEEIVFLEDRLDEFNATATGIDDGEWLAILVRDDEQRI